MPTTATALIPRYFTSPETLVEDTIPWDSRDARIMGSDGWPVFEQRDVEVPTAWSQNATNIVASKYFRVIDGIKESSVRAMGDRVVRTITHWGTEDGYFTGDDAKTFAEELMYILLHQMACFNSPVWFNIGVPGTVQQSSACYIISVEDSMPGILEWYRQEGMIFSRGSGAGVNISSLRGQGEPISRGGTSSGPLSFMRAADASAFSIKSGGTTRRSARMVVMDVDHPDIQAFITAKLHEEQKARTLAAAGYDTSLDGDIYATVAHQNCNMSVRVPDDFMEAALTGETWQTRHRTTAATHSHRADVLLHALAEATWACGDPGLQFDTCINAWHTCPHGGRIRASNPCSEYFFLDNTACNLSSINLLKFLREDGCFDSAGFRHTVDVMITAMDILVSHSEYPTEAITQRSHTYRTVGLGYANLGALLMAQAMPYDSDAGRQMAASVTALMTGEAYAQSGRLAASLGAFPGYAYNAEAMQEVLLQHQVHLQRLPARYQHGPAEIQASARVAWEEAQALARTTGMRNAQVTVLAPTGTISFMMDCITTGVEPDIALVNYKKLVGGGTIKHINPLIASTLHALGYDARCVDEACQALENGHALEELAWIHDQHVPIFDCAFPQMPGGRSIAWEGHVKMVGALQPFISGGISKTINVPNAATVEDIKAAYVLAWRLGCKSIAIYRDGCKETQVLTTQAPGVAPAIPGKPIRRRLPDERHALNHKFRVGTTEGYLNIGLYEDGTPGEIFVTIAKEGSTLRGLLDSFACMTSLALQYGVPLDVLVDKFTQTRFEPAGFTGNPLLPQATSVIDYIFRYLQQKFAAPEAPIPVTQGYTNGTTVSANCCQLCGTLLVVNGTCHACPGCGFQTGCTG